MTSPFWSVLLCWVLIVDNQLANLSSIHDAVYSITHIIIMTICVYCNFNIL